MTWIQFAQICTIVFAGSMLQSAVGFGLGLFSMPLMIVCGVPITTAVSVVAIVSALQSAWSWFHNRQHVNWRDPVAITLISMIAMPAGIFLLEYISTQSQSVARKSIGAAILVILLAQLIFKVKPRQKLASGWSWLAGGLGGFLTGLFGTGGPPLVMWVMAHDWSNERSRAFLWLAFLMMTPAKVSLLLWRFGDSVVWPMAAGFAMIPAVMIGALIGMYFGRLMSKTVLRGAMVTLLAIIAITSMI